MKPSAGRLRNKAKTNWQHRRKGELNLLKYAYTYRPKFAIGIRSQFNSNVTTANHHWTFYLDLNLLTLGIIVINLFVFFPYNLRVSPYTIVWITSIECCFAACCDRDNISKTYNWGNFLKQRARKPICPIANRAFLTGGTSGRVIYARLRFSCAIENRQVAGAAAAACGK